MHFEFVQYSHQSQSDTYPRVVLTPHSWDDNGWKTTFVATWLEARSTKPRELGLLRILQRKVKETRLPDRFEALSDEMCSLGCTPSYYRSLARIDRSAAQDILVALRDVAFDEGIEAEFTDDDGFERSLVRMQRSREALAEARQLFRGAPPPRPPDISFRFETRVGDRLREIDVDLSRERPLGRIAAVIGPNGCGKTRLLGRLAYALLGYVETGAGEELRGSPSFTGGVIAISWSAFDQFRVPIFKDALTEGYSYVGLRRFDPPTTKEGHTKVAGPIPQMLYERLDRTFALERAWDALRQLEVNERERVASSLERMALMEWEAARDLVASASLPAFSTTLARLSSGQQILVFTMLALKAALRPGTMVLFDEPESHLHPTLLAAFLRELHELLEKTDSFAILATHSPLVLQEIPAHQVSLFGEGKNRHYDGETFGESISRLMDYAFGVGGERRNWREIVEMYRAAHRIEELERIFHPDLNLPLRGLLAHSRK